MQRTITLSIADNSLKGKYKHGDIVLVECDAVLSGFTVTLPDGSIIKDTRFIITKTDSSANEVTFTTENPYNSTINGGQSITLTTQHETKQLLSDSVNYRAF